MSEEQGWRPVFEAAPRFGQTFNRGHYNVFGCEGADGMELLRQMFPTAEPDEMTFVLFSTSGVHGSYASIEQVEGSREEWGDAVTFLVVKPRTVVLQYGLCKPQTPEDFAFLKELRERSWAAIGRIGRHWEVVAAASLPHPAERSADHLEG